MLKQLKARRLFMVMVALILVVASYPLTQPVEATIGRETGDIANLIDDKDQLLVWNAPALEPQRQAADSVGALSFLNSAGQLSKVADVAAQSSIVQVCAVSPDGRHVALFMGVDGGVVANLYLMTDGGEPVLVSNVFQRLGCIGSNALVSFSADNSQLVYVDYERNYQAGFADGVLYIKNVADLSTVFSSNSVVATAQSKSGVAFINFFPNDRGVADEAAVTFWNGNVDRELGTFIADKDCYYLDGSVTIAPDGILWAGIGYRCAGKSTLDLYRIDPETRSQTLVLSKETGGAFSQITLSNNIYVTADSSKVIFAVPDGVVGETASLHVYDTASGDLTTLIDRLAVMPNLGGSPNAGATLSPDGNWLAVAVTSVNTRTNTLQLWNLGDLSAPKAVIQPGGEGDIFSYLEFTADSKRLVMVAGGPGGLDNSIQLIELGSENLQPIRVRRGVFSRWATLSPAGTDIAILEYQVQPDNVRGPDFLNLVAINLDNSESVTLVIGGVVEDGEVKNLQFAAPLRWTRQ